MRENNTDKLTVARAGQHETERLLDGVDGMPMIALGLVAALGLLALITSPGLIAVLRPVLILILARLLLILIGTAAFVGLTPVAPGEARVIQLFGHYSGTIRTSGLRRVNPFAKRRKVSTRIRNHETTVAKVNDADGNPIEIAAVVVWRVEDTAQAMYEVDNFVEFVGIQAETAVRHIATRYPYDGYDSGQLSLRENAEEITSKLSAEIATRVAAAGVNVIESRITRLAYAPEIAMAMLRRQQAGAIVAARQRIVEGAVGMVDLALRRLEEQEIVELDMERKAAMVSNLLVVLCSDHPAQPVVNTGTLYQ